MFCGLVPTFAEVPGKKITIQKMKLLAIIISLVNLKKFTENARVVHIYYKTLRGNLHFFAQHSEVYTFQTCSKGMTKTTMHVKYQLTKCIQNIESLPKELKDLTR